MSCKFGLLALLCAGDPEMRKLAASSFSIARLAAAACIFQVSPVRLDKAKMRQYVLLLLPRLTAERPRSISCQGSR